ncbi:MAG: bifunctional folylpolyglutamate synthase/dihydrofolate synthase [Parachlamydia sp.]|nr:bifunctional folylpolyglutamate synthase/dihydrofolate synthase [Parachlamydia sp.]
MYSKQLERLYAISLYGMKFGLENIQKLDASLGYPSRACPVVHIAGTNGKGSVSTKIAKALQVSGKRVGLYTSPHIATFRERIRMQGEMIAEEEAALFLREIFDLIDRTKIPATFFEVTTLLAFLCFARHNLDIAVLEVGLGGRLDATNIVSPILSVITSISLDHTDMLGSTLEEIAREKAGIIKPFVPILAGPRTPQNTIEKIATVNKSPYFRVDGIFASYDEENRAVAKRAMELLGMGPQAIQEGLSARPPCRMEEVKPGVILDVGHNPDGLEQLFHSLRHIYPDSSMRVVCALSKNKDLAGCLAVLRQNASFIHLTEAPGSRAAKASDLARLLYQQGYHHYSQEVSINASIHQALSSLQEKQLLVICGTFFMMADARGTLGLCDPRDATPVSEKL